MRLKLNGHPIPRSDHFVAVITIKTDSLNANFVQKFSMLLENGRKRSNIG